MEALLIHLDEELTNNRPGHSYRASYTARDLAFWTQFYCLFCDSLMVPANFLTDSNLTPAVLHELRVNERDCALRSVNGSFQIFWDENRFPYASFTDLVRAMESEQLTDVSLRSIKEARLTAALCDKYLNQQIIRKRVDVQVDYDASVRLLRTTVFDPNHNAALEPATLPRLQECLDRIVDRGGRTGYGRDFFYQVFGYGRTQEHRGLAGQFADVVGDYEDLRHAFLTGVDYASNTIKAECASRATGGRISVLLPVEYQHVFRRPHVDAVWRQGLDAARQTVGVDEAYRYLIDPARLVAMTGDELTTLKRSTEYGCYRAQWYKVRDSPSVPGQGEVAALEHALTSYLAKIASTLSPARYAVDRGLSCCARTRLSEGALVVLLGITAVGQLTGGGVLSTAATGAELLTAVWQAAAYGAERIRDTSIRRNEFTTHGFQLPDGIEVAFRQSTR